MRLASSISSAAVSSAWRDAWLRKICSESAVSLGLGAALGARALGGRRAARRALRGGVVFASAAARVGVVVLAMRSLSDVSARLGSRRDLTVGSHVRAGRHVLSVGEAVERTGCWQHPYVAEGNG